MTQRARLSNGWFVLVVCLLGVTPVWAGGMYLYEVSVSDIGLGSAGWTARANDASTIFKNPAGMSRLEGGELLLTLQPVYLDIQFTPDSSQTTTTGSNGDASGWLPLADAYYVHGLSDTVKLGIAVGGYFGLAAEYENDWVGRYYIQKVQLQTATIEPAASFRVSPKWSLGVGAAVNYGILNEEIAVNNTPLVGPDPMLGDGLMKVDSTSWGIQANLGVMFEASETARFGLQYLSQGSLDFATVPEFTDLRPALEAGLGAAGLLDASVDLSMEMPQAVRVGGYFEAGEKWALMGDLGWEQWSRFGKVGVAVTTDESNPPSSLTVDRNYEDTWHAAIGARRRTSGAWTLLFGTAYDSSMVEDVDRTPDLPLGPTWRVGVGGERKLGEKSEVALAYEYIAGGDLPMDVNRGPLAGRVAGTYEGVALHFLALSWRRSFPGS